MVSGQSCAAVSIPALFIKHPLWNNAFSFGLHLSMPTWCWEGIHKPSVQAGGGSRARVTVTRRSVLGKDAELPPLLCHYSPLVESPTLNPRQAPPYPQLLLPKSCLLMWRYLPFHLQLVPSPLEGVAVFTGTSTQITGLQLIADFWENFLHFSGKLMLTVWTWRGGHWYQVPGTDLTRWIFDVDQHECTRLIYY